MKKISKILLDLVISFGVGAVIGLVFIVFQSLKYTFKYNSGLFVLTVGWGNIEVGRWQEIAVSDAAFICIAVGVAVMVLDLIYMSVSLLLNKNQK